MMIQIVFVRYSLFVRLVFSVSFGFCLCISYYTIGLRRKTVRGAPSDDTLNLGSRGLGGGLSNTGNNCLFTDTVNGYKRLPVPPDKIIPFITN